ncbi:MAG: hypothetical protein H7Y36_10635 [Armatimonadetes bacterium]|nr:hypothetical protein [Akkermansiaceae bacterium]
MRKTFPMEMEGHKPPRVIESIKSEIRKYLKRERRKALPEGVDFWDFDCQAGPDGQEAKPLHVEEIIAKIDEAGSAGWKSVYIEILAKPGHRLTRKPQEPRLGSELE